MQNTSKRKSSFILRFAVFALAIYMIVSLCSLWVRLVSEQSKLNQLKRQAEEKNHRIAELTAFLDSGSEKAIIEKAARERLGYVYADEQVYVDVSGN